jgi:anthraniloyl-CoA monooxygenase
MPGRQVVVVGGGPAGMTAARILKLRQPSWDVTVLERQPPDATFGYGVGLSFSSLNRLRAADPELIAAIERSSVSVDTWTMRRDGESISAKNSHGLGIGRAALLAILQRHAEAAGVRVRMGRPARLADVNGADLVLAADGVGSEIRGELATELGATVSQGELAYLWCGAALRLTEMTLALTRTPAGPLAAHVMPYAPGACTFQVDGHRETVAALGLPPAGPADSTALLQEAFADLLGGDWLGTKRPEWSTFATVACTRWHAGNVVVLGDAAHTAHYTVGFGTALAVEDAVELAEVLAAGGRAEAGFEAFEAARRPTVERLQRRADRSQRWWTTLAGRFDLPLPQLLLSYLTRTGAITLPAAAKHNAGLIAGCLRRDAGLAGARVGDVASAILAQPFGVNGSRVPDRIYRGGDLLDGSVATIVHDTGRPTLEQMRGAAAQGRDLAARGVTHIRLAGPPDREAVLDRLELAEGLRQQAGVVTIVAAPPECRDDLALGVLCGRTDLAEMTT